MEPTELIPSLMSQKNFTEKTSELLVLGILPSKRKSYTHSLSLGTNNTDEREAVIEICPLSSCEKTDLPLEKRGKAETCPGC